MQRWEEVAYARQDGIIEGKNIGIIEGKKDIILNMLKKGMEVSDIMTLTECDMSMINEVKAIQNRN